MSLAAHKQKFIEAGNMVQAKTSISQNLQSQIHTLATEMLNGLFI